VRVHFNGGRDYEREAALLVLIYIDIQEIYTNVLGGSTHDIMHSGHTNGGRWVCLAVKELSCFFVCLHANRKNMRKRKIRFISISGGFDRNILI